jgi:SPP1 family predicted phage head-tail adaptor
MRIGTLRERITIYSRESLPTESGGSSVSWVPQAEVWANVSAESGSELEATGRIQSQARYTITIRNRTDLKPDMRVVWRSRMLNIITILQQPPDTTLLKCEELGDAGDLEIGS